MNADTPQAGRSIPEELLRLLDEQLALVKSGQGDAIVPLVDQVDGLLRELSQQGRSLAPNVAHEIQQRHKTLRLALAGEKDQLAKKLHHIQKGKRSVQAYQDPFAKN